MVDGSEDTEREIRSFGCDGPDHRNKYRCRLHCRHEGYKTGSCTKISNYKECVCLKSNARSEYHNFIPVFLNITRL